MAKINLYFIFLLILCLYACLPQEHLPKEMVTDESKVIIYLQPMPQEAAGLRFIIDEIVAVREDGLRIPLYLSIHELKGADLAGFQKRLASGFVTPGAYTGISIKVAEAFVQTEEGEISLFVPESPVLVSSLFKAPRKGVLTLFLRLSPSVNITRGVRFTPDFSLSLSGRGLTSLKGYVSNSGSDTISEFNKNTMQVTGTIATGKGPMGIVLDKQRARAYVAASGSDAIEIIDVTEGKIVGRVKLNFGDDPIDLALTPDGRTLVSVNSGSDTVSIIDAVSEFEIRRIKVGQRPVSAVVDSLGVRAYIMNSLSNTLSVVDLSQQVIAVSIGIEGSPLRGAFNRRGDQLYVISADSPHLSVIDPKQLIVTEKLRIGMGAVSIKIDLRTDLILVGKGAEGEIAVISPFPLMVIDTIGIGDHATFMTIDDEENSLFVTLPARKAARKINLTSKRVMAEIDVGEGAYAVVVMGER